MSRFLHHPKTAEQEDARDATNSIPDGGTVAWLQCLSSFCLLLNSFGITNSFGAFQTFYERSLLQDQKTRGSVAWIGSIQAFLLIGLGIFAGPLYDRGHLHFLVVAGAVLICFGTVMTGLCSRHWQLLLSQGVVVGTGCGCLFLPSIAVLPQWFEKRRSLATGIGSSGSAGGIVFPILFNHLQPRIGFKWSVWIIALILFVTSLIPILALRMRHRPTKIRGIFEAKAWTEAPFVLWALYLFISLLGLYIPSFYIQQYGIRFMNETLALYLLPILNAGSFFGRIIPLYLADKMGPLNMEILATLLASALGFAWIAVDGTAGVKVFSFLYGFFAGCVTTVTAPIDAALSPNLGTVGERMGMPLLPWALGLLVGIPIGGEILAEPAAWLGLQAYVGTTLFVATGLAIAVRVAKYGWRWSKKC